MRVLCVDDALPIMEDVVAMCRKIPGITSVKGFTRPREAAEWLETHPVDLSLLDIDMPEINGLMLAEKQKRKYPDSSVIFLTAYRQYAVQAVKLRATGYLLKPVSQEELEEEVAYARSRNLERPTGHIVVQTFGNFEIYSRGEPIKFRYKKTKELLAYLIDRRGSMCTNNEIIAVIWEDDDFGTDRQDYLKKLKQDLINTLNEIGAENVVIRQRGQIAINPKLIECDLFKYLEGDSTMVNSYQGEYMSQYSWAEYSIFKKL